jgi:hypothetical protein
MTITTAAAEVEKGFGGGAKPLTNPLESIDHADRRSGQLIRLRYAAMENFRLELRPDRIFGEQN